jgi:hypothetical protein
LNISGSLDDSQNFFFIPLLHTRTNETLDDLEENVAAKSVLVVFETLSVFPGNHSGFNCYCYHLLTKTISSVKQDLVLPIKNPEKCSEFWQNF